MGPPCLLPYLNSSVMLDNYLQQTTSADVSFQIFLGALRVNDNGLLGGTFVFGTRVVKLVSACFLFFLFLTDFIQMQASKPFIQMKKFGPLGIDFLSEPCNTFY